MRFLAMVRATGASEAGEMPSPKLLEDMGRFNEELVKAGILLAAEGLHPSQRGARIRYDGRQRTVIDGPFAETKELIAGFWLLQCSSLEEAIEWLKRAPNPFDGMPSEVEIRRVFEMEDFGDVLNPEQRQHEQQLRATINQQT
ncbi:YciI family protein [Dyella sp. C9]|uniref:YciI family protein n=1 Tax=Dyella sp. C9 TaxID=2202154 RepID=UPI000DEF75ED|nr:YciI family protein [Dyella sp. C9]